MTVGAQVRVDYRLVAAPGFRFIWAMHALVMPDVGTRLDLPAGHPVRAWPSGATAVQRTWPRVTENSWDRLGEDDGSAVFALLPGLDRCAVTAPDGSSLGWRIWAPGQPVSIGLFRNLGGFPDRLSGYRTLGIEPMIGHAHELATARPAETGCVPASGEVEWSVAVTSAATRPTRSPAVGTPAADRE
ncbi:hypothetical protein [Paraoerskovia sediminicola]|nr:hypothetical protein [Paraoerskovia sediminicola]